MNVRRIIRPSENTAANRLKAAFFALGSTLLLAACAVSDGLPKPQLLPVMAEGDMRWFKLESLDTEGNVRQTSLLAVQPEQGGLRFVQTDALGAPVSRQSVSGKGWKNDGFVAPNAESRRLFAAMLPLLAAPGQAVYPQQVPWRSEVADGHILIVFPDNQNWRISPLKE